MIDEPPPPPPPASLQLPAELPPAPFAQPQADGRVVIDLTQFAPPSLPSGDCDDAAPDPFNPEIVVCDETAPAPRLSPQVGPVDEAFGSAIPRARIRLSDTATAEANSINKGVGGINANGGEVRLKIDF